MITIIGIKLDNRIESSEKFQSILTKYGCIIKTRLGLHPNDNGKCSNTGIILLEIEEDATELKKELEQFWEIQSMDFD